MADALLKGRTPIQDIFHNVSRLVSKGDNKVQPDSGLKLTGIEKTQHEFCETALLMLMIYEASALLVVSAFWGLTNSNPNEPGSLRIPRRQKILNTAVMLFGEVSMRIYRISTYTTVSNAIHISAASSDRFLRRLHFEHVQETLRLRCRSVLVGVQDRQEKNHLHCHLWHLFDDSTRSRNHVLALLDEQNGNGERLDCDVMSRHPEEYNGDAAGGFNVPDTVMKLMAFLLL